jgi:hypothetical protein
VIFVGKRARFIDIGRVQLHDNLFVLFGVYTRHEDAE